MTFCIVLRKRRIKVDPCHLVSFLIGQNSIFIFVILCYCCTYTNIRKCLLINFNASAVPPAKQAIPIAAIVLKIIFFHWIIMITPSCYYEFFVFLIPQHDGIRDITFFVFDIFSTSNINNKINSLNAILRILKNYVFYLFHMFYFVLYVL